MTERHIERLARWMLWGAIFGFAFLIVLLLAGLVSAGPPASYQASYPRQYALQHAQHAHHQHQVTHAQPPLLVTKQILFAEAFVPLFDLNARDVFVFYGPPAIALPAPPAPTVGTDALGRELAVGGVLQPQHTQQSPTISGYEDGAGPVQPAQQPPQKLALASLRASCAECHGGGKSRGGFGLFDAAGNVRADADWAAALAAVEQGRMPPRSAGKPPVSAEDLAELRRLAGAK